MISTVGTTSKQKGSLTKLYLLSKRLLVTLSEQQPPVLDPLTAPTISREQFFQPRLSHNATSKVTSVVTYSESKTETAVNIDGHFKVALSQLCDSITESTDNVITVNRQRKVSVKTNAKDILS